MSNNKKRVEHRKHKRFQAPEGVLVGVGPDFDRPAPRKPRPEGRGQGELYEIGRLPFREAPPGRAGRLHKVGRLRDVSMDGLSFRYIGNGEALNGSYVDVFMTEGDFYLGKVPIEIVSDIEVIKKSSPDRKTLRRCCVKFKKLTPQQRAKLQEFIDRHIAGEA